ncbi:MAG: inositol monophosphatase family protein [Gammaproteobacteria bacterium]
MHPILNIADTAARAAGELIIRALDRIDEVEIRQKGTQDIVTAMDIAAEECIIDTIKKNYPDHSILAEESGSLGNHEYQWIIDPIDGTRNFAHGFPHFCISIAVAHEGKIEHGLIYDPVRQEVFSSTRGRGAYFNNRRMRVSKIITLENALLATGFPHRDHPEKCEFYLNSLGAFLPQCDVRRGGSAALDLAYVACGRLDGFWEHGLNIWDIAAGALMVVEAGGLVGDLNASENHLESGNIVAANAKMFKTILQKIKPLVPKGF